ncbi:polysaccharide biosynthesis protein, partial [Aquimarina celericrescens]|nr:polysaccharide biosynthesis protein [Aquimarina celericrescens]
IIDLAKQMIRLSGFIPYEDIDIVYTGLRPGEKLYEELLADKENTLPTHHQKILIAKASYDFDSEKLILLNNLQNQISNNNVLKSIEKITSPEGLGMSPRRITLSTSGVPKMIKKLADDEVKFHLAVSLHSAIDEIRTQIM